MLSVWMDIRFKKRGSAGRESVQTQHLEPDIGHREAVPDVPREDCFMDRPPLLL